MRYLLALLLCVSVGCKHPVKQVDPAPSVDRRYTENVIPCSNCGIQDTIFEGNPTSIVAPHKVKHVETTEVLDCEHGYEVWLLGGETSITYSTADTKGVRLYPKTYKVCVSPDFIQQLAKDQGK